MNVRTLITKRLVPEVLSRPVFQRLNKLLFRLAISGMGVGNHNVERRDELRLLRKLRKLLPPDATILDVGANIGQFATIARKAFPDARIYSFEPNPAAFAQLQKVANRLKIHPIALGCGSAPGIYTMFDRSADAGTAIATLVPGVLERRGVSPARFDVELTTVDLLCESHGFDQVDLLKIDVEGFESEVLAGASRMLSERRVRLVQFEFNQMNLLSHTTMDDVASLLAGYALHRVLYNGDLLPLDSASAIQRNLFAFQNIVAVLREEFVKR